MIYDMATWTPPDKCSVAGDLALARLAHCAPSFAALLYISLSIP